jgi:PAS domain S-box-containing protein
MITTDRASAAPASLEDVLFTAELARRPARPADHAAESRALSALAAALAESPDTILQKLADLTLELCRAESAGVSLLEEDGGRAVFRWPAIVGAWAGHVGGSLPRDASPCGVVIDRDDVLLFTHPERHFALVPADSPLAEVLLAPFHAGGAPAGTVWAVFHTPGRKFDAEDARLLTVLAGFASAAHRVAALGAAAADRAELERRVAERTAELRASEERFRLMVQAVQDHAIFMMDPAGNVTSWNEGAQRILGYEAGEVLGRPGALFFTEEDRRAGAPERELRTAAATGRASDENWQVRKGGERFWASGATTALRDPAGGPRGFVKIFRDLTERRAAEEKVRESEERLRVALAAGEMGTWLWRIPQDEQVLDDGLRHLMGLGSGEEVRTLEGFLRAVHPADRDRVRAEFERCVREGGEIDTEFRVLRPGGAERWLKDQGKVFRGADGKPQFLAGACVDITARKQAEEELERRVAERTAELRESQWRALQSERLAAIGAVAAGLAHESQNALQRAQACLTLLEYRLAGQPEALELLGRLQRAQDDLQRHYEDVREYAGPVQLRRQRCDARAVWREAWSEAAEARPGRGAAPREEGGDTDAYVWADPFRLRQVFLNLIENALAAGPEPVTVTAGFAAAELDGLPALRVTVADDGPGFAPEILGRLFEPFVTTKMRGTGLGLAICRRLVEAHGGRIEAAEGPAGGAAIVVTLPRDDPPPVAGGGGNPSTRRNEKPADERPRALSFPFHLYDQ